MAISVEVHLLSGKRASLEIQEDAPVEELNQRAQSALSAGKGRLLSADGRVLDGAETVKQAGIRNGEELYLQVRLPQVTATWWSDEWAPAFATILGDGSVVTSGDASAGGDSSSVQAQLKGVQHVQASRHAFAAILGDGSVVTWGDEDRGGDSSSVQAQLKRVQHIQSSSAAFAAILADGSVVTWGDEELGGDSSSVQAQLKGVQHIQASAGAFAAILGDGSVVTWGAAYFGGDSSSVQAQLQGVQSIQASIRAFAAILLDGSVVTWGDHPWWRRQQSRASSAERRAAHPSF